MENNIDKLFKSKLGGLEPEFHPAAWERMEGLLDESGMTPAQDEKSDRTRIIYLFLLFFGIVFSVVGFQKLQSTHTGDKGSALVSSNTPNTENKATTTSEQNLSTTCPYQRLYSLRLHMSANIDKFSNQLRRVFKEFAQQEVRTSIEDCTI